MKKGPKPIPAIARFWNKVEKGPGCWTWLGQTDPNGYGRINLGNSRGRCYLAHRFSWEIANKINPGEWCILHSCDNPTCVRPDHLFAGTQADNVADMIAKGRDRNRGEANGQAKLTEDDVREIRKALDAGELQREIAARYGVHQVLVSLIKRRIRWAHVV